VTIEKRHFWFKLQIRSIQATLSNVGPRVNVGKCTLDFRAPLWQFSVNAEGSRPVGFCYNSLVTARALRKKRTAHLADFILWELKRKRSLLPVTETSGFLQKEALKKYVSRKLRGLASPKI
jgi:hypothetical protein